MKENILLVAVVVLCVLVLSQVIDDSSSTERQIILTELREISGAIEKNAMQREIDALKRERESLRGQVLGANIRSPERGSVGSEAPTVKTNSITIQGHAVLGSPTAPVTMVEFSDYQCPYCQRHFQQTYPALKEKYIDKGILKLVLVDFPIESHAEALPIAQKVHCAGEQDRFWEFHDSMFQNMGSVNAALVSAELDRLGMNAASFTECLENGRHIGKIKRGLENAKAVGIQATPTFIIGRSTGDKITGDVVMGAQSLDVFESHIQRLAAQ